MVKIGVGNNALNGLYFYPKPVQEKVYELGLIDRETVARKRKRFMTAFFAVMAAALILIIRVWNGGTASFRHTCRRFSSLKS